MTEQYRTVPASEVFGKFSAARRRWIQDRAAVLIAEERDLQESSRKSGQPAARDR